uniref:Uncharacterized protein n=1 Tax=Amphimedon queenslandica TaxID=400682 RepID=A0A1X7SG63_AMPQE
MALNQLLQEQAFPSICIHRGMQQEERQGQKEGRVGNIVWATPPKLAVANGGQTEPKA